MRGMLVHYLIERDFSHEEASSIANALRDSLAKEKEIARKEFLKILTKQIRKDYGERSVGDLVFWEPAPAGFTVETEDGSRPFSREILSHSIQATGLAPDSAYQVARAIASRLADERREQITHRMLEDLTADMLAEEHGKAYSERYRLWMSWGESGKPLIVLIGGSSGVGKTSLAMTIDLSSGVGSLSAVASSSSDCSGVMISSGESSAMQGRVGGWRKHHPPTLAAGWFIPSRLCVTVKSCKSVGFPDRKI